MKRIPIIAAACCLSIAACASAEKGFVGPKQTTTSGPLYPFEMMGQNLGGNVNLMMTIDKSGHTNNCQIISSTQAGFNRNALDYCKSLQFVPAKMNGIPVDEPAYKTTVKFGPD